MKDNGDLICVIFLDLAKAFDTVNHKILVKKMEYYGLRGVIGDLLSSFLTNRKQFINVSDIKSEIKNVTCGIPQGSVLGPLLFLLYINDMPSITTLHSRLFADDTVLFTSARKIQELQFILNQQMPIVNDWFSANKLTINSQKTYYMIIDKKNSNNKDLKIVINKSRINKTNNIKYLGVYIDDKLSWNAHIEDICKRLSKISGMLYKLRYYVNRKTLLNLYYALVHSFIQYGLISWGSASQKLIHKVEVLQNRIIRTITFSNRRERLQPLYKNLNILPINHLYKAEIAKLMFKNITQSLPQNFQSYFKEISNIHKYETRGAQNSNFFLPRVKSKKGSCSLKILGPKIWNNLPTEITELLSIKTF